MKKVKHPLVCVWGYFLQMFSSLEKIEAQNHHKNDDHHSDSECDLAQNILRNFSTKYIKKFFKNL